MRILIISYLFGFDNGVGGFRSTYWAMNLPRIDPAINVDVISTSEKPPNLLLRGNYYRVQHAMPSAIRLIKDKGTLWLTALQRFVADTLPAVEYEVVIITGSPFMHFGIAKTLKEIWGCRIVLDFRDPFANNPRFGEQRLKRIGKRYYEEKFVRDADTVLSVNKFCMRHIHGCTAASGKYAVVRNGFDEECFERPSAARLRRRMGLNLIYAGKLYDDFDINPMIAVLEEDGGAVLHMVGRHRIAAQSIELYGELTYAAAVGLLKQADFGLLLTGGKPFESTTKLYDYIGADLPIVVVTQGEPRTGAIYDEVRDLDAVYWCRNNAGEIAALLERVRGVAGNVGRPQRMEFSRRAGTKKLHEILLSQYDWKGERSTAFRG
jgi:hypothetical protein